MKLNQLMGKEIINLADGEKLGMIAEVDISFTEQTGELESILVPIEKGGFSLWGEEQYLEVPWDSIVKIGNEVVIIDLDVEEY
jgi:YlmC/YmxH family sporulation protein